MSEAEVEEQFNNLTNSADWQALAKELATPNIFSVLKLGHHEIRHSNFLAWLLDPKETHGLGSKYLKIFLEHKGVKLSDDDLNEVILLREWEHIDIVLITRDRKKIVVIENKIYANETGRQLKNYDEITRNKFPSAERKFIFLTLDGHEPSYNEYVTYSYERIIEQLSIQIIPYLECPLLINYVKDYIQILRKLTMKDDARIVAKKIYLENRKIIDFINHNIPNTEKLFRDTFEDKVNNETNFYLGSKQKNFVRFLTNRLKFLDNKRGNSWQNKESFLFELCWQQNSLESYILVYCTINPGDDSIKNIVQEAMRSTVEADEEIDKKDGWIMYLKKYVPFDVVDLLSANEEAITKVWDVAKEMVTKVEKVLLPYEAKLK